MKLFKRVLICIAAIVLLTGAAAGCSTDTGGPSATPAPDGSPSQSADASATPDQAAGQGCGWRARADVLFLFRTAKL